MKGKTKIKIVETTKLTSPSALSWILLLSSASKTRSKMMGAANKESSHVLCKTMVLFPPMNISDVYSSMALLLSPTYGTYYNNNNNGKSYYRD